MAGNFITFDASLKNNKVGIGIYDNLTKESFNYITDCPDDSLRGETIALGCALSYVNKTNRKEVHLFTDNKQLANLGIPKQFKELYPDIEASLRWIPRELNKEADLASKHAFFPHVKNPSVTKLKNLRKSQNFHKDSKESNLATKFKNFNKNKKVEMLEKLAVTKHEQEITRMLKNNKPGDYNFQFTPKSEQFIKLAYTIFQSELGTYSAKRFKKVFTKNNIKQKQINNKAFKNLLNQRNYFVQV